MISYAPLWETMDAKGVAGYELRYKANLGGGTIQRLRKNETVSTSTLDFLCKYLCRELDEIAKYVPSEKNQQETDKV